MSYGWQTGIQTNTLTAVSGIVRVGRQKLTAAQAAAADADGLLAAVEMPEEATDVIVFENVMPYARSLTAVCSNTQAGKMTVYGTDIDGVVISEEVTLNGASSVESTKAFKTVTKINLPAAAGTETINVGWGDKIGIPFKLSATAANRPKPIDCTLNGVIEGTAAALTADAATLSKNLIDLNSALNGTEVNIYYFV